MSVHARHLKSSAGLVRHRAWFAALAVTVLSGMILLGLASAALAAPIPTLEADPHGDGISGLDWPTGTPTIISVFADAGASSPFFETSVVGDAWDQDGRENFYQYLGGPYGIDLQAGQKVVVGNGDTTKTTVVTGLTVTGVNVAANTVWGETDPGFGGDIRVWEHDELNSTFNDNDADGQWSYVFPDGTLQQGWGGSTNQTDADGDSTVADWHVPDPHFVVDPGSAQITGQDWGLRANVTVTVFAGGSATPSLVQTSGIEDDWSFIIDVPPEVTIHAGDRVVATDGTTLTTMTVSPLAITSFDATTGVASGICMAKNPPSQMSLGIDAVGGGPLEPSTGGTWTAAFDWRPVVPLPLPPGTQGWVEEHDPSGNTTRARWRVPEKPIAVDHHFEVIEDTTLTANFLPGDTYYGPTLDASFTTQPMHGTVDFYPSMGGFTYRPVAGFSGTDSFRYTIADSTPWQTLWADPARITVTVRPWYLGYSTLTTTTIGLQWPDTADALPDFDHYLITDNSSVVATTTGTSRVLGSLTPGSSHVFGVQMVDTAGQASLLRTLTITIPQVTASAAIVATESATAELGVQAPGSTETTGAQTATVTVVMTGVTTGGQLTLVKSDAPPADAPPTLKFIGEYYDLSFSGSFDGTATITVPYDPRIPDSRARALTLQHWANGQWEDLDTTVDVVKHTLTASVTSLSPIVVAEPELAITASAIKLSSSALYPAYGAPVTVNATLKASDASSTALAGFTLILERQSGSSWVGGVTLAEVPGHAGSYRASVKPFGGVRTVYRVRLATNPLYSASSAVAYVVPHAKLTTPKPSKSSVAHRHTFYVTGRVYPKGARWVSVRIYRYSGGKYRYSTTKRAKSKSTGSYKLALKLKKTGSYKFKAYVGDNSSSAALARSYSALSGRIKVK